MNDHARSVLITGCSSGIGRASAEYLAGKGFKVFAGVRREEDARKLRDLKMDNLLPVCPLDLTKQENIKAAAEWINDEAELYAVVNNAGGGFISPIELMDLEKFSMELETRLVGSICLLQEFLPMIRKNNGRVIWIVTPGLMPLTFDSSIHACDFAVNNIARTLKLELLPWNIPVILIKCGTIKTEAVLKSYLELEKSFQKWPYEKSVLYRDAIDKEVGRWKKYDSKRTDPEEVAKMVFRALTSGKPAASYRVGYMSGASAFLELLPHVLVDYILGKRAK